MRICRLQDAGIFLFFLNISTFASRVTPLTIMNWVKEHVAAMHLYSLYFAYYWQTEEESSSYQSFRHFPLCPVNHKLTIYPNVTKTSIF